MKKTISDVLLAIVLLAISLLNLYIVLGLLRPQSAETYVETQAVVTKVETVEVADVGVFGGVRRERRTTVEYSVNGKKLVSQLIDAPKKYVDGTELTVFYDVNDPTEVTLSDVSISSDLIAMASLLTAAVLIVIVYRHGLFSDF